MTKPFYWNLKIQADIGPLFRWRHPIPKKSKPTHLKFGRIVSWKGRPVMKVSGDIILGDFKYNTSSPFFTYCSIYFLCMHHIYDCILSNNHVLKLSVYAPTGCYWQIAGCWEDENIFFYNTNPMVLTVLLKFHLFTGILIPHYPSEFNTLISVYESELYPSLVCFQESEKRQRLGISDWKRQTAFHNTAVSLICNKVKYYGFKGAFNSDLQWGLFHSFVTYMLITRFL